MNIHLGLALVMIVAGALLVGLTLSDGGPRLPHVPGTPAQHGSVEAVASVGGGGQG